MSMWTHITACLSVNTGLIESPKELKKHVKQVLKKAPKITGSEKNADVFVNIQSGYNFSMSHDCDHCEYNNDIKDTDDGEEYKVCGAPEGLDRDCSGKYQTCVVISIQGDLRDRTVGQTQKEFDLFWKYLNDNYYHVKNYSINIEGE